MDKCYNGACDDYDPCVEHNCRWRNRASTELCWGFVGKEQMKKEHIKSSLGLGKLSDPEYGCTPERNGVNMGDNKKGGLPPNNTGCSRMSARSVLLDKIERCKKELRSLQTLEESIQWENLSVKDEELLWHYFSSRRESY